ncbi:hypothetical protein BDR26DRAFT_874201 [Obelidium mucronatum]|nr:hypothetical protein BDR26DRAFT_874201 [Obelidium mucronatum]
MVATASMLAKMSSILVAMLEPLGLLQMAMVSVVTVSAQLVGNQCRSLRLRCSRQRKRLQNSWKWSILSITAQPLMETVPFLLIAAPTVMATVQIMHATVQGSPARGPLVFPTPPTATNHYAKAITTMSQRDWLILL